MKSSRRLLFASLLAVACSGDGSGPGNTATRLALAPVPGVATAGSPLSPAVQVTALDAAGNTATSFTGSVSVALAANPGGATLSGTTTVTAVGGIARFANLILDRSGTGFTLTATAGTLRGDTSAVITVGPGPVAPGHSVVTATPGTIVASGGGSAATITVTARDAFDNPVPGATVVLAASGSGNAITQPATPTNAAGTTTGTISSTVAEAKTVSATVSSVAVTQTASVTVSSGSASQLAFTIQPSDAASGNAIAPSVVVSARDAFGNLATGFVGTVTVAIASNPGAGTLSGTVSRPVSNGAATFTDLNIDKVGTGYTLQASASPALTTTTSTAFAIVAGTATKLAVIAQPTATTGGVTLAPAVQVEVEDAAGNRVTSASTSITLSLGTNPSSGALGGTTTRAASAGVATFDDLTVDSAGAGYILAAAAAGLSGATSNSFNVTVGTPARLGFLVQPTNAAGGAVMAPAVQVEVRDAGGNRVTTASSQVTVAFGTNPNAGTLGGTKTVAAGSGIASFAGLTIDSAGAGYTLTASAAGLTGAISNTFAVTVGPAARLGFRVQPSNAAGGATITPPIEVEVRDLGGNRVTSASTSITLAIGSNPGSGTLSGTKVVPAASGIAIFSTLSIDKVGVGYTLTASGGGLTGATSTAFDIGVGAPRKLAFFVQPSNATGGAAIAPSVQVEVQDSGGNRVTSSSASITVALGTNPKSGTLGGTRTRAAASGVAAFNDLTIDSAATGYTLTATAAGLTGATSATFTITVGAPANLGILVQPGNATGGAVIAPAMRVEVRDAGGNRVTSAANLVTVAIGDNPNNGTLGGTKSVAAASGVATFSTLTIDSAGTGYTLTANATSLTGALSGAFNITVGAAAKLGFHVQPVNTAGGATITPAVQVEVQDLGGNRVASATTSITVAIGTNPASGILTGTIPRSAVNGLATFSDLSIDKDGTGYTLTAAGGGLTGATSTPFNIAVGGAAKLAFSVQPSNATGGATIAPAVTVEVQDAGGNLVTTATDNVTVALGTNPKNGALGGTKTLAAVNGVATFNNLTVDSAATGYTLTAAATGLAGTTSNAFNVAVGPAARLAYGQQPTSATGGVTITPALTVRVLDAGGNLTASTANVAVAITSGTGTTGAHLSGTATIAAVSGVATFSTLSIDSAGTGYTLRATSAGLTTATSSAFTISVGPATALGFLVQPSNAASGAGIAPAIKVEIRDAGGNRVTGATNSITLAIQNNPSGGALSGTAVHTPVSGVATFSGLSIDKSGIGYTLQATSLPALAPSTSASFNITAGAPDHLAFSVQPADASAGASIAPAVQVEVLDAVGNLTSATTTVTVAILDNPSGGALSGTKALPAVAGVATFSTLSIDKAGTGYTLQATAAGLTTDVSADFNITPGAAVRLSYVVEPVTTTAGATIAPAVQVEILDAFANRVATATNSVTVALLNANGAILSGTKTRTASAGVATFNNLSVDKTGSTYRLRATSSGLVPDTTATFTITPGVATQLVFTQQPTTRSAGASITPSVQVTAQDAHNNTATGFTGDVTLAIGTNPGSGTLSGTLSVAAASGVATFPGLSIDKVGTGYTLVASATGPSNATSGTFNITVGAAAKLAFGQQPAATTGGIAISPAVTVRILDASGNLTASNASVTLAITSGTGTAGAHLSGGSSVTLPASGGIATFSGLSVDSAGAAYTLNAASGVLAGDTSSAFNVTVGAGAKLDFLVQPSTTPPNGTIAPAVQVEVRDAGGNLVTADNTTSITVAIGANPGSGTLAGTKIQTAAGGVATFANLSINSGSTGYTLTAAAGGLTGATSNSFDIVIGTATKLAFGTQPGNITGGATMPAVTVEVRDAGDNVVAGATNSVTLSFGTNPKSGHLSGTKTVAAVNGIATFDDLSVDSAATGYTLSATSSSLTSATSASFDVTVGPATRLGFRVQPANTPGGAAITPAVQIEVRDAGGNRVTGATNAISVEIGTNPNSGTLSGTTTLSAAAGVASFGTLKIDSAGTGYRLIATAAGLTDATSATFNITVGTASQIGFIVQPSDATAGSAIAPAVEVEIRDAGGNRVTTATNSVTAAIGSNPGGGTLGGTKVVSAVAGVATFSTLSINKSGVGYTLQMTAGAFTPITSIGFDVSADGVSASLSSLAAATDTIGQCSFSCTAGVHASTVTVTVKDQFGNLVSGSPVVLSATGTGNGFTPAAAGNTDASGVFTAAFNSSVAEAKTISATAGGIAISQTGATAVMPVLVGAGDIADCNSIRDDATANQLDSIPGVVFAAGDNAYANGTDSNFVNCYEPTWGRHKARTRPVVGNHEYDSSGTAAPYMAYFGASVADPLGNGFGYYSYEVGTWHVVVLNSDSAVTNPASGQLSWLQSDLVGRGNQCVLAIWHRPLFTSGSSTLPTAKRAAIRQLWQALQDIGAEIVINGHDHLYERFAPQLADSSANAAGIREFIVGTGGGETHSNYSKTPPNVEASDAANFSRGVLRLTLYDRSYRWEFLPAQGQGTFTDSGTASCH